MIPPYDEDVAKVEAVLAKIGMRLIEDGDFGANFENDDGWKIFLWTEPHDREGYNVFITSPETKQEYSLLILEEAFREFFRSEQPVAGPEADAAFVAGHWDFIVTEEARYRPVYEELKNLPWEDFAKRVGIEYDA